MTTAVLSVIWLLAPECAAAPASDNATDAAYADGWQPGDNGGIGFLPWDLSFTGVTAPLEQPGPHFIDTAPPLPGNTLGAPSFGLTTSARPNFGDTSEASRRFSVPLAIGETFSMDVKGSSLNPGVEQFSAGNIIRLLSGDETERFAIFTNNGYQGNQWVASDDVATPIRAASEFHIEFTLTSPDTYDFTMRPIAGGAPLFSRNNATLGGTAGTPIDRIAIGTYGNGSSADGSWELFFNNLQIGQPAPIPTQWNVDRDGNWSGSANWTAAVPNGAGQTAVFGDKITADRTVAVDVPITVGAIDLDNTSAYTLGGSQVLNLDATAGDAKITVVKGDHTISAPLSLPDNTVITTAAVGSRLSITGELNANGVTITKEGAGVLDLSRLTASGLTLSNGLVSLQSSAGTSVVGSILFAGMPTEPSATFDLKDNALVVDYSSSPTPAAIIRSLIVSGRGGAGLDKQWNGTGITSSTAGTENASNAESHSIGYAENNTLPLGPYSMFRGQSVDDTSLLIAFTRTGDANLDGVVNDDDVTSVSASYAPAVPQPFWALGDFDYNGFVDDDDVTLLGAFYDPTSAVAGVSADARVVAVPEPNSLALIMVSVLAMLVSRLSPKEN
jgi:hypothetical protein